MHREVEFAPRFNDAGEHQGLRGRADEAEIHLGAVWNAGLDALVTLSLSQQDIDRAIVEARSSEIRVSFLAA
jgi:hypothetical protein